MASDRDAEALLAGRVFLFRHIECRAGGLMLAFGHQSDAGWQEPCDDAGRVRQRDLDVGVFAELRRRGQGCALVEGAADGLDGARGIRSSKLMQHFEDGTIEVSEQYFGILVMRRTIAGHLETGEAHRILELGQSAAEVVVSFLGGHVEPSIHTQECAHRGRRGDRLPCVLPIGTTMRGFGEELGTAMIALKEVDAAAQPVIGVLGRLQARKPPGYQIVTHRRVAAVVREDDSAFLQRNLADSLPERVMIPALIAACRASSADAAVMILPSGPPSPEGGDR